MVGRRALVLSGILILLGAGTLSAQPQTEQVQPVDVYLRSARIALQTTPPEYDRAMRNLEMARKYYPDNFEVHFLLGTIWAERDEIDSMMAEYDRAQKLAPPKEWEKKAKNLDKVIEAKWVNQFNDRAVNYLQQADSISDMAVQAKDSASADSLNRTANQIRILAAEALRRCMLLKPLDFRAASARGVIYQRRGQLDSALADFVHAENLFHRYEFDDSTTNWYDTTTFFTGPEGEPTEAYKAFDAKYKKLTEEKRNRYKNLMLSLAAAYYDAQKWPECIALNRRYHAMFPKDINAIVTLADVFARLNRDEEAFKWQESVVREDPNSKDTWYNMGIFYYNTAIRLQDSVQNYDRALKRNENDQAAKAAIRMFVRKSLESFARAIPRFTKVVELDEKDQDTWRLLAICYYSTATLAIDEHLADDAKARDDYLLGVGHMIRGDTWTFSQQELWDATKKTLDKGTKFFPDDNGLCKMMKITLAQLGLLDDLKTWSTKCP